MNKVESELMNILVKQIGYQEQGKNITKYSRWFDVEAWQFFNTKKQGAEYCAIGQIWAVCQVLGTAQTREFFGFPAPKYNCAAGCGYFYDYLKKKGYQTTKDKLKPLDYVFFKSGKSCSHVGIVEKVDSSKIYCIEFNVDNKVKRVTHNRSSNIYFGFMSPDWSKAHWIGEAQAPAPAPLPAKPEAPAAPTDELKAGQLMIVSIKHAGSELMLRAYPSGSAPIIQRMKKGWKVTYLGEKSGSWLKVRCNKLIGWSCQHEASKDYDYLTKA